MTVLPVEQELAELRDNEIYVVLSGPMTQRIPLLQNRQEHPYQDETYMIKGEWEGGYHAFFPECRSRLVDERADGNVAFTFECKRKMLIV